ncbi:DUF4276 family protein [Kitasatospora sp. NPDC006697]|uniref:DUF4276 family protein n=1 Tax=Kitasatospora sp. NPDC006697 TaxID=3364020 RepID=UPI00369CC49B
MRYLDCALVCEGASDRAFLPGLMSRAVRDLCAAEFETDVQVEVRPLWADHQRTDTVLDAAARDRFDLLLYHHDGAPEQQCERTLGELRREWDRARGEPLVPVVPLRETEAWIIADPAAVAFVLGGERYVTDAGLPPRAREAEHVTDPKVPLRRAVEAAQRPQRRSRRAKTGTDTQSYFTAFAEHVSIGRLREVPSFDQWWKDMIKVLEGLGYRYG